MLNIRCAKRIKVRYKRSAGKLSDVLSTRNCCHCMSITSKFCYQHTAKVSQSNIPEYTNSLTFPWLYAIFLVSPQPVQNSLIFPDFQKSGNPDDMPYIRTTIRPRSISYFWTLCAPQVQHCLTAVFPGDASEPVPPWVLYLFWNRSSGD